MMSIKGGTQTWSTAPQNVDLGTDRTQNLSALDKAQHYQDEEIGDVLNKVSDPNWVDPAKKMRTVGQKELGKDAFMSLLLTQMKNQDPTNPLKSHEMAAQLAQFTSLEKLHNINEGIDNLRKDAQPNQNFQALSFIGKAVTTDNSKISRLDQDARHDLRFSLPGDAQKLELKIKDKDGNVIRNLEFKNLKTGKNEINWNGIGEDGQNVAPGDYVVEFEAFGSNGKKMFVETKTEGVITGVNFTPRGPQLMVGKQVVNMADIKSIAEPAGGAANELAKMVSGPMPLQDLSQVATNQTPKKIEKKPEFDPDQGKRAKLAKGDLNDASMAQGLINRLNKEGAKAGMDGK